MDKAYSEKKSSKKNRARYNFYVFAVCLFFSALTWVIIKLSKDYNIDVNVGIDYNNIPKDRYISKADTTFIVTYKVNGFRLLRNKLPENQRIVIDLQEFNFSRNNKNRFFSRIDIAKHTLNQLLSNVPYAENIVNISPQNVLVEIDYAYSKKVPVIPRFSYSVEKQHFIYNTLKVEPDSVWVYGSKSKVMGVKQLETDSADYPNLTANLEEFLKIKNPVSMGFHLSQNFVKVQIPVEKFTEMELNVPVKFTDNYTKTHIKIFPENVKLTLMVAMKDYKNISPEMFRIIADTTGFLKSNYLSLRVESAPAYVKVSRITPETVEYIRIK